MAACRGRERAGLLRQPAISATAAASNLALDGPLGIGGLRVVLEAKTSRSRPAAGEARWRRGSRRARATAGFALPLAELRWWLLGIPAPGEATVNQDGGTAKSTTSCRRVAREHQFARGRLGFLAAAAAHRRARRARLKLLVERWQRDGESE
jgi:outer membrane biogenesis lipoprotein LolB